MQVRKGTPIWVLLHVQNARVQNWNGGHREHKTASLSVFRPSAADPNAGGTELSDRVPGKLQCVLSCLP